MVTAAASSESVLAKLLELQTVHKKAGKDHEYFGVDTLSMLFSTTREKMLGILNELQALDEVTLTANVTAKSKSGKGQIWFVSLCKG